MPVDRSTIIRGPATVTWGGVTVYTAGDIQVTPKITTFKIPTDFYGDSTDERVGDMQYEITFTPSGVINATWMTKVYDFLAGTAIGASGLYSFDLALVVWAKNGEKHTFENTFPSKPGDITFSATKPLFGPTTFTAMRKLTTAWSTANSLHKIETASFVDTSFLATGIPTGAYSVAWGATAPFSTLLGAGDAVFSVNPTWEPVETNPDGIVDYRLKDLNASVKFQPLGCTLAQLKAANIDAMSTALRGASIVSAGKAFTITGAQAGGVGPIISATMATPVESPFQFGSSVNRVGEVEFRFVRVAPTVLFTASIA